VPLLYSYCIPYDDGAAPNPFWGICTLVICKPVIRRAAEVGDWVAGTGSKNSPVGDTSGHLVYAMRVEKKLTMKQYDEHCRTVLLDKIPDWRSSDPQRRVGDSIYDFSTFGPVLRPSVHSPGNYATDLGGRLALLSSEYYYFGKGAVRLPEHLLPIVRQEQGHRSSSNAPIFDAFIAWIRLQRKGVNGTPQMWGVTEIDKSGLCRAAEDQEDERQGSWEC